jgi:hypothetical protein
VSDFRVPDDLSFNRGLIADPAAFASERGAASWVFLCGAEFAAMDGGISYGDVQTAVTASENVVSDPPRDYDLERVRDVMAAIDRMPRPTLVTCRTGPRSSAAVYLYSGLRAGASAEEVLARAAADEAPFVQSEELRALVARGLDELSTER